MFEEYISKEDIQLIEIFLGKITNILVPIFNNLPLKYQKILINLVLDENYAASGDLKKFLTIENDQKRKKLLRTYHSESPGDHQLLLRIVELLAIPIVGDNILDSESDDDDDDEKSFDEIETLLQNPNESLKKKQLLRRELELEKQIVKEEIRFFLSDFDDDESNVKYRITERSTGFFLTVVNNDYDSDSD